MGAPVPTQFTYLSLLVIFELGWAAGQLTPIKEEEIFLAQRGSDCKVRLAMILLPVEMLLPWKQITHLAVRNEVG